MMFLLFTGALKVAEEALLPTPMELSTTTTMALASLRTHASVRTSRVKMNQGMLVVLASRSSAILSAGMENVLSRFT